MQIVPYGFILAEAEIVNVSRGLSSWLSKYIFLTSIGLMAKKKETITKIPSCNESIKAVGHYFQFKLSKNGVISLYTEATPCNNLTKISRIIFMNL